MRQVGIVREVNEKYAVVEVSRKSACEGCHANSDGNCSACVSFGKKEMLAKAENSVGAAVGDRVLLETDSATVIIYAAAIFLLPIMIAAAAYVICSYIENSRAPYIGATVGFALTFLVSCFVLNRTASKRFDVRIIRVL